MQQLISDSHETAPQRKRMRKRAGNCSLLLERKIIRNNSKIRRANGGKLRLNIDLQEDFSLNHAPSLYLIDTLALLDMASPTYPLDMPHAHRSILEIGTSFAPPVDELKTRKKWRNETTRHSEYDERIAKLDELEYPKPQREFVYNTFNAFV